MSYYRNAIMGTCLSAKWAVRREMASDYGRTNINCYFGCPSKPIETHNTTNEWFNNSDLFVIKASPYDGCPETSYCNVNSSDTIQWIRVRKPPPNNILPVANTG
jgi:hypothetical protein